MHQRVDHDPREREFLLADMATCLRFYRETPDTHIIERDGFLSRAVEARMRLAEMDEGEE